MHTFAAPIIGSIGLTVIIAVALHPVAAVKVILAVPPDMPVAIPLPDPMIATEVLPLIHELAGSMSLNVIAEPAHIIPAPAIAAGNGFTVIDCDPSIPHPVL